MAKKRIKIILSTELTELVSLSGDEPVVSAKNELLAISEIRRSELAEGYKSMAANKEELHDSWLDSGLSELIEMLDE